jgi:hypothetical protein
MPIENWTLCNTFEVTTLRSPREIAVNGLRFLLHLMLSTVGVPVMASVLRYSFVVPLHQLVPSVSLRTGHWILLQTPYFPVQIAMGLLLGFQLGRRYRHRVMLWTWTVPCIALALLILFVPFRPIVVDGIEITKIQRFFGWSCLPQNHCFEQVGSTMPFYAAGAYSLGAFFARVIPGSNIPGSNSAKPTDVLRQTAH